MEQTGTVNVRVWGDYACFSRPEFKVERVSYPVITPSAARGLLEAIYWKPEMRFEIRKIGVLRLGTQMTILRNELNDRQSKQPICIDDFANRAQRSSLILKDVEYLIEAEIRLRPHAVDHVRKYVDCFERRLAKGQCHHTPYLGTREFAASFARANGEEPPALNMAIGTMLFDIAFIEDARRNEFEFRRPKDKETVKGYARALFFDAKIASGWLEVPGKKYAELYRLEENNV